MATNQMKVGYKYQFRVKAKQQGEVEVIGLLKFDGNQMKITGKRGIWYGFELAEDFKKYGKNNGSINGTSYMKVAKGRGVFVKAEKIIGRVSGKAGTKTKHKEHKIGAIETGKSEYELTNFGNTKTSNAEKHSAGSLEPVKKKTYVVMKGEEEVVGRVKFIGKTFFKPGKIMYGLELAIDYKGDNNGSHSGTSYFECEKTGQGYFCLKRDFVREASGRAGTTTKVISHKIGAIETGRNDDYKIIGRN